MNMCDDNSGYRMTIIIIYPFKIDIKIKGGDNWCICKKKTILLIRSQHDKRDTF